MRIVGLMFGWMLAVVAAGGVLAAPAVAQEFSAGGEVTQIGFEGAFQPTGWVPMKVRLTPPGGESGLYTLRVHQRDLDGDNVVYERSVTLTGGLENQAFWTYFKPEPVDGGLPANDANGLRERLRVTLSDEDGRELAQLQIPRAVTPLYSGGDMLNSISGRGKRLVLFVSDPSGGFMAGSIELQPDLSVGFTEEIEPVYVTTDNLPDRAIGYDSVDTIVWQNADPAVLLQGTGDRMTALRNWLQQGGHLVVTARSEWQTLEPIFDLLPVTPTTALERPDLDPLRQMVNRVELRASWESVRGPFRYVVGQPTADATVEQWFFDERLEGGEAPFLARRPTGFGLVSFVAVDLGDRRVAGLANTRTAGWGAIWSRILGTGDQPILNPTEAERMRFSTREFRDLGAAPLPGTRLAGRSVALVTVALVFFIGYWLIAGPGLYFYLAAKGRTPLSWFVFGATAVVATVVTLGVVRLVLRGPPDMRHISVVRQGDMAPQVVHSEMGLYIPRDGEQRLIIDGGVRSIPPTLTGFSTAPAHTGTDGQRTNPISYVVSLDPPNNLPGDVEGSAAVVDIPYRSTLKKLEADWVGPIARAIDGRPRLVPNTVGHYAGPLTNSTGRDLVNVHIAYRYSMGNFNRVVIIYWPVWRAGQPLPDLQTLTGVEDRSQRIKFVGRTATQIEAPPSRTAPVWGYLDDHWARYWYSFLRSSLIGGGPTHYDDWNEPLRRTPAMLSFFSLLPPMQEDQLGQGTPSILLRRGARDWDISTAILAGHMVIVAESDEVPLPIPLEVEGDRIEGEGRVVHQFIVPVDRTALDAAEAQRRQEQRENEQQPTPTTNPANE